MFIAHLQKSQCNAWGVLGERLFVAFWDDLRFTRQRHAQEKPKFLLFPNSGFLYNSQVTAADSKRRKVIKCTVGTAQLSPVTGGHPFSPRIIKPLSISERRGWDLGRNVWRQNSKSSVSHSPPLLQSPLAIYLGMLLNEKVYDSSSALNHMEHSLKDVQ